MSKNNSNQRDECDLIANETFHHPSNEKYAIILNHEVFDKDCAPTRRGTNQDVKNLKYILPKLNCDYVVFNNLTKNNILANVPKYVESYLHKLKKPVGLLFFILSHGAADDELLASDCLYNMYDFVNKFNPAIFPMTANESKLFFISACRGEEFQTTHTVQVNTGNFVDDSIPFKVQPRQMYENLLIAFGTIANKVSMRNRKWGTFFIQELSVGFDQFIRDTRIEQIDIMDILLTTNDNLTKRVIKTETGGKQLSQVYSSLTKPYVFTKNV